MNVTVNELGQNFGRPESLLGLTERGVEILKEKNLLGEDVPYKDAGPVSSRLNDHQFLLNWLRVHLAGSSMYYHD